MRVAEQTPPRTLTPAIVAAVVTLLGGGGYAFHKSDDMPSRESLQLGSIELLLEKNFGAINQHMDLFRRELKATDENVSRSYRRLDDIERVCRQR